MYALVLSFVSRVLLEACSPGESYPLGRPSFVWLASPMDPKSAEVTGKHLESCAYTPSIALNTFSQPPWPTSPVLSSPQSHARRWNHRRVLGCRSEVGCWPPLGSPWFIYNIIYMIIYVYVCVSWNVNIKVHTWVQNILVYVIYFVWLFQLFLNILIVVHYWVIYLASQIRRPQPHQLHLPPMM